MFVGMVLRCLALQRGPPSNQVYLVLLKRLDDARACQA